MVLDCDEFKWCQQTCTRWWCTTTRCWNRIRWSSLFLSGKLGVTVSTVTLQVAWVKRSWWVLLIIITLRNMVPSCVKYPKTVMLQKVWLSGSKLRLFVVVTLRRIHPPGLCICTHSHKPVCHAQSCCVFNVWGVRGYCYLLKVDCQDGVLFGVYRTYLIWQQIETWLIWMEF